MGSIIAGLVNQTIDYMYSVTYNKYGDKTTTEEYSDVPCRWQEVIKQVVDSSGEQVVSNIEVWLLPSYNNVRRGWKITKDSQDYFVITTSKKYNLGGQLEYIKLFLA